MTVLCYAPHAGRIHFKLWSLFEKFVLVLFMLNRDDGAFGLLFKIMCFLQRFALLEKFRRRRIGSLREIGGRNDNLGCLGTELGAFFFRGIVLARHRMNLLTLCFQRRTVVVVVQRQFIEKGVKGFFLQ